MNILGNLWAALTRLAGNVNALADTVDETNSGLRQRLGLDVPQLEDKTRPEVAAALNGKSKAKTR